MSLNGFLKKIALVLIYGVMSSGVAFLIALFLIKKNPEMKADDVMFFIGIFIMIIGAFAAVGGNPTGLGPIGTGLNSQQVASLNIEITAMERNTTKYFESTANHTKLYFTSSKLNIILNGAFVILSSILLGYFH